MYVERGTAHRGDRAGSRDLKLTSLELGDPRIEDPESELKSHVLGFELVDREIGGGAELDDRAVREGDDGRGGGARLYAVAGQQALADLGRRPIAFVGSPGAHVALDLADGSGGNEVLGRRGPNGERREHKCG